MDEQSIFLSALERETATSRAAFLDEACAGNEELRQNVERLLQAHERPDDFLARTPVEFEATEIRGVTEKVGDHIGPYRLLERIDQGGMGVVYLAEQTEPVRRRVALKIIKPGMDTQQVIHRFEAERQALAMMDHPNIAKVFDAGATNSGRPYFVMELVKGVPITQYCDEHQLTPRERLEIFTTVCQAVQHSHQKGIIHRDLKPSNVLVSSSDGRPVAKVIDFGLAKATGRQLIDKTVYTQQGQIVGTVEYMSPEQADLNPVDIDTRTDIYSLGVLLYELLTGETPFDRNRLRSAAFNELLRIIREEEPPRPSVRLSSSDALPSIAANRHCEPKKLSTLLRGELDWIVMKSLEKDRTRRYETANGLASDIGRYLNDEAVTACPPSASYRFTKFARRNKAVLLTTAAILVCLLAGITGTTWQAIRATKAEKIAVAERDDKELARRDAEANAKRANEAADSERQAREEEARQRMLATAASEQEKRQRQEAERLRLVAEEKELLSRRNLYAAHMNLAQQALAKGHTTRVQRLLERHVPIPGEPDWRQFEWYYLLGECHRDQWAINASTLSNVAFSPDSSQLAVPNGFSIEIWDISTRKRLRNVAGSPNQGIYALAYSPDGRQLLSGSQGLDDQAGECILWDVESGAVVLRLEGIQHDVTTVDFSPDGRWIVAADGGIYDNKDVATTIRVWDAKSGRPLKELEGHLRMVSSLAFNPDGRKLVSAEADHPDALSIWDMESGARNEDVSIRGAFVTWSHDGAYIGTCNPNAIWNAETGELIHALSQADDSRSAALGLSFSPDGKQLAFAMQRANDVQVFDVATGDQIDELKGHTNWVWRVAYSPDGRWLASTSRDGTVKFWDVILNQDYLLPGGKNPWEVNHARGRKHIALSADGSTIAATQDLQNVTILDLKSLAEKMTLNARSTILAISLSSDGKRLAIGSKSTLQVWDVAAGRQTEQKNISVKSLCFSSDDQALYVGIGKRVEILDANGLESLQVLTFPGKPHVDMVSASPDGRHLAIIAPNFSGAVYVWDLAKRELRARFDVSRWTTNLAFSRDGRILAASGGSWFDARSAGVTKLWDMQTLREIASLKAHDGLHTALAFTPDGSSIATASDAAEITLWDLETFEERISLNWGSHPIDCLIFSPDRTRLISGNSYEAVKLWQSAATDQVLALESSASMTNASRYSQAGDWERATVVCSKLIEREDQPNVRVMRAEAYAELGRWKEAIEDFSVVAEMYPFDYQIWLKLALAQVAKGDHRSYAATTAKMLANYQSSSYPAAAEQVAWAVVVQAADEANWSAALRMAMNAVESDREPGLADIAVAAALYRGACFPEVVEWMTEVASAESINNQYSPVYGWYILAMAHHQLGHQELAEHWLQEATQRSQQERREQETIPWNRRLTLRLLQEEAEKKIRGDSPNVVPSKQLSAIKFEDPNEARLFELVILQRRAQRLANAENWKQALVAFSEAVRLAPEDWALLKGRGHVYEKLGQWNQALEDYLRSIDLNPAEYSNWDSWASDLLNANQWDKAIAIYSKLIEVSPSEPSPYVHRARAYNSLGEFEKGLLDCDRAIQLAGGDYWAFVRRAWANLALGKYQDAIKDANRAIELDPKNRFAFPHLALAHRELKQWPQAIEAYSKLIELEPNDAWNHVLRAELHAMLGDEPQAINDCDRAVEISPENVGIALIRAQTLLMAGQMNQYRNACAETLDRFGQSEDPNESCHAARVCTLAPDAVSDLAVPVELAKNAVARFPTGSYPREWMLYTLGMASFRAGQMDEAEKRFLESIQADPQWHAIALNWLGLALVEQGKGETEAARQWTAKATALMNENPLKSPQDRLEAELLRRELEQLLKPSPTSTEGSQTDQRE